MLTAAQEEHFRTFGFLFFRKFFDAKEMAQVSADFDDVMAEGRSGQPFSGTQRQVVMGFLEKRPSLMALVEDDRIYETVVQLIQDVPIWISSEGLLYVGQTLWHSDARIDYPLWVKVAFYLDPLGPNDGCLRVIPGSHRAPFHTDLVGLRRRDGVLPMGEPSEIPCTALPSVPGDVLFFDQRLFHASFGGEPGRRSFSMNFATPIAYDAHRELLEQTYQRNCSSFGKNGEIYSEPFLHSNNPRISAVTKVIKELGFK